VVLERVRIDRSQPPIGGEADSPAGLGGAGLKREYERPMDSGRRRARRYAQWPDCRHHAPTSIAPSSMAVTDCGTGRFCAAGQKLSARFACFTTSISGFSRWVLSTMVTAGTPRS